MQDENLLEQFVVDAATSGMIQSGYIPGTSDGSLREANETGRDFITGLSANERAVVDHEYNNRVAEARDIYINEYIKGGNAMGINPYLSDAEYDKITTIDWTEGEDLRDFLIDNGYDYDGLVLDEGADGGYGDAVVYRGQSYCTLSSRILHISLSYEHSAKTPGDFSVSPRRKIFPGRVCEILWNSHLTSNRRNGSIRARKRHL